ncbi:MAG: phosphoribosylanthranilate isomerase [Candidatus Hydrogenedentota bacterium]|nr:MAG: phosphoribosylanthranilate isomerase [Candidatus Hydrogenedentota bacterium]
MIVKICGIRSVEDALFCGREGADWIGVNLWRKSVRSAPIETFFEIWEAFETEWPGEERPKVVALFVSPAEEELERLLESSRRPDFLQIHGEWDGRVEVGGIPVIRAVHVGSERDVDAVNAWEGEWVLVDAKVEGLVGGTGRRVPETLLKRIKRPYILAGGLTPETVVDVVARFHPAGVDVASGVESAPGIKDRAKIRTFLKRCHSYNLTISP